jgi:hypothetical protein
MSCPLLDLGSAPLCDLLTGLKSKDPKVRSDCAEEIMKRVERVERFMGNVKAKFPKLRAFFEKFFNEIQAYNEFAASTVRELTKAPGCAEDEGSICAMLGEATGFYWHELAGVDIHEAFDAPKEHVDLDWFDDPVKRALAEHARNEKTREAAAELMMPYDEAVKAVESAESVEKSEGAKKTVPVKLGRYADFLPRSLFRLLKHHDPATQAKAAEELLHRVRRVKEFLLAIKAAYPNTKLTFAPGAIDQYSGFALSTVEELFDNKWRVKPVQEMLIKATGRSWNGMDDITIHQAFYAPNEHMDLRSFKVPVLRALAAHAEDASMRKAAADLLRLGEEAAKAARAEESKPVKRTRDADLESEEAEVREVREAKKRQPLPFGYAESLKELEKTMCDSGAARSTEGA